MLKAFWSIFLTELKKLFTYRAEAWMGVICIGVARITAGYFLWKSIFEAQPDIATHGGKTFDQMVQYYVFATLTFFAVLPNPNSIAPDIYEGQLSKYLLYPISYLFNKYVIQTAELLLAIFQFFVGIAFAYVIFGTPILTGLSVGAFVLYFLVLFLCHTAFFLLVAIFEFAGFWSDKTTSLWIMLLFLSNIFAGVNLPLSVFPDWLSTVAYSTPFPYLVSLPTETLLSGTVEYHHIGILIAWITIFFLIVNFEWKRGLRNYSGVGI